MRTLITILLLTLFMKSSFADPIEELRAKAEQGDATAQAALGTLYREGVGVSKDNAEAVKWLRKAAEQGVAAAQFRLREMEREREGMGAPKNKEDDTKTINAAKNTINVDVSRYREAAQKGDATAQAALGTIYHEGLGVPKNDVEALKWYRMAAKQGDEVAKHRLLELYSKGIGVQKNKD